MRRGAGSLALAVILCLAAQAADATERATERGAPAPGARDTVRPPHRPPSQISPAEQQQRRLEEQRRAQQPQPQAGTRLSCRAYPACRDGRGRCQGVEQVYDSGHPSAGRDAIADLCVQANTPDECNCAQQCRRVARCNNF